MTNDVISFPSAKVRTWADTERLLAAEIGDPAMSKWVLERVRVAFDTTWFCTDVDAELATNKSFLYLTENYRDSYAQLLIQLTAAYVELYRQIGCGGPR